MSEEKAYAYWLSCVPGVGAKAAKKLLNFFGTAENIYRAKEEALEVVLSAGQVDRLLGHRRTWDVEKAYARLGEEGISFLSVDDADYPKRLSQIPDPPYGIFYKGRLPRENKPSVAIIGARECSEYGRFVAQELGAALAGGRVAVISGMARGIDSISQQAALEAGGFSLAVLGCGVDICYPAASRGVYEMLLESGGILSPYPPGTQPKASLFPPRNRIVSGLADVVIVVEARLKSGTLITVDMALEQGREVYAVPGRLTDRLSDGCNKLIRQGAGILLSPTDFLGELGLLWERKCRDRTVSKRSGKLKEDQEPEPARVLTMAKMFETEEKFASEEEPGPEKRPGKKKNQKKEGKNEDVKSAGKAEVAKNVEIVENVEGVLAAQQVLDALDFYPRSAQQVYEALAGDLSYPGTLRVLTALCLKGRVRQVSPGQFCRIQ